MSLCLREQSRAPEDALSSSFPLLMFHSFPSCTALASSLPLLCVCGSRIGRGRPTMLFCVMAGGAGPTSAPVGKRGPGVSSLSCCSHCCSLFQGCSSSSSCNNTSSSSSTGRTHSFSLHPHPVPQCSVQRQTPQQGTPASVITVTHHRSPTASNRACSQHPAGLHQVKEVGTALD